MDSQIYYKIILIQVQWWMLAEILSFRNLQIFEVAEKQIFLLHVPPMSSQLEKCQWKHEGRWNIKNKRIPFFMPGMSK